MSPGNLFILGSKVNVTSHKNSAGVGRFTLVSAGCQLSSSASPAERMSDLVEDLVGQLGAERDDKFRRLSVISLVADDVQPGQRLDVV